MLLHLGIYLMFLLLKQEMHRRFENAPDSAKTKALQTVIEMKVKESNSFYQIGIVFLFYFLNFHPDILYNTPILF